MFSKINVMHIHWHELNRIKLKKKHSFRQEQKQWGGNGTNWFSLSDFSKEHNNSDKNTKLWEHINTQMHNADLCRFLLVKISGFSSRTLTALRFKLQMNNNKQHCCGLLILPFICWSLINLSLTSQNWLPFSTLKRLVLIF